MAVPSIWSKKNWALSKEAFELLLAALAPERERAGEKYELLRLKLVKFFSWQTISQPDELADEALNIAARKLSEGQPIVNLPAYCLAVARKLVIEQARALKKTQTALLDPGRFPAAALDPDREFLLEILDQCLEELPVPERRLLLAYYGAPKKATIEARKALAGEMGIPLNALRIRAWRLRSKLEQAVSRRLEVLARK